MIFLIKIPKPFTIILKMNKVIAKIIVLILVFFFSSILSALEIDIPLSEFNFSQQEAKISLPPESIIIDFSQDITPKLEFNQYSFVKETLNNKRVAKFFKKNHRISITSHESLLGIPSFSSIFSIYLSFIALRIEDGITLARFFSVNTTEKSVEIRIENSKIVVDIKGIVSSKDGEYINLKLITDEKLNNNEQYEFSLVFDTINSKISIYLNGVESDRKVIRTGNINLKNSEGVMEFFPEFFGFVDRIVIAPTFIRSLNVEQTKPQEYVSRIIDTKDFSTQISEVNINGKGNFSIFVRTSTDITTLLNNNQSWLKIDQIKGIKGRYIQLRVIPIQGEESYEFNSINLKLSKPPAPQKPSILFTTSEEEGSVTIHWQNDLDDEIEYYEIFYGDYKNKYFGKEAINGPSPIRVKKPSKFYPILKYTIRGLHPHKEYFFAIRSVRKDLTKSEYSEEVRVIPSKTITKK